LAAEDALDAAVPFLVELIVSGAPSAICDGAEEVHRLVRQVRRTEGPYTDMRPALEPVIELIRLDGSPPKPLLKVRRGRLTE
jgi:hypothetical protein